jgi:hypothetical protein
MNVWSRRATLLPVLLVTLSGLADDASAAVKIRKPILEEAGAAPTVARPVREDEGRFIGEVIFSRGGQVVAEIPGGATEGERMVLYDQGLRRLGKAVVSSSLEAGVFLLQPVGGFGVASGAHLARESELEAAARVLRANDFDQYREFVEIFPDSEYAPRVAREMFRIVMKGSYPTFPGTVIEGRIQLAESVGREVSLGQVMVVLDRFIIARTDEKGRFRIEGVPKLERSVTVGIRVKDPKLVMAEEETVDLPAEAFEEVQTDLSLKLTPTILAGQVIDEHGAPLPGVEVWTHPHSMEVLTDEEGMYRLSRRKKLDTDGGAGAADEPLFGGEYEVFAYRKGYGVERSTVSAESYRSNPVAAIRLLRQDLRQEAVPGLGVDLRNFVDAYPVATIAPSGTDPKINR